MLTETPRSILLKPRSKIVAILLFLPQMLFANLAYAQSARDIVKDSIDYWRGGSSYFEAEMTVHRPDWERSMSMKGWTEGRQNTLVRFTAPAKDAGNATLTLTDDMWSYSSKINRIIKIPPSMKGQSWMGSDFSYDDLSKSDDIVDQYDHKLLGTETNDNKKVYIIESIPHETAPVVWGKEILKVREDNIILVHEFYDQNMQLVKSLRAIKIEPLGGRIYATLIRMEKLNSESAGEWTQILHKDVKFDIKIPSSTFTLSNLSNPRS